MKGHAVVIGGGIGGLLAASALSGRFEQVTVLERYRYPRRLRRGAPPARRGVPQSRCLHMLLAGGMAAFDELVPGWREEALALGAVPFDASADAALRFPSGWLPRVPSGIMMYACSRALLEQSLRRCLAKQPAICVREDRPVVGLVGDRRRGRVVGVRIAERVGSGSTTLDADLTVDASGRGSALPGWLRRIPGADPTEVEETVVESGRQYVSRWFHLPPGKSPDWHCLSIASEPGGRGRSAMMLRAEDDRWGVVLLGPAGEPLPAEDEAFLDFTTDLGEGTLRAVLAQAEPLSPIHRYGPTSSRMRHYERVTEWPDGLVAIGDSVCALDPYFGLGMTATARGAALLKVRGPFDRGDAAAAASFQRDLLAENAAPWALATGRGPDGDPLPQDARHAARFDAAPTNASVAHEVLAVQHMLKPPASLLDLEPS